MHKMLVLLIILISTPALALRFAYTTTIKTLVYADKGLDIPIGYIRSGRKIRVADKSIKNNTIARIIVTGRVAYVKIEDLTFKLNNQEILDRPTVIEHDVDELFITDVDRLSKGNYLHLALSTFSSGDQWDSINKQLGGEDSNITMFTLGIGHRTPESRNAFAIDLNYASTASSVIKFQTITLSGEYQYKFFQTSLLSSEVFAALHLSGDARIKTFDGEKSKGVLYGTSYGARIRIFPYSKISFYASLSITALKPSSLEPITANNEEVVIEDISGTAIGFGIALRI